MRILMVPHAYAPSVGGVERVVEQLARSLVSFGHSSAILTDSVPGAPDIETLDGIPVWRLPFLGGGRANSVRRITQWPRRRQQIAQIIGEFKPDVIHIHVTSRNVAYARLASQVAGCPYIITTHGSFVRGLNRFGLAAEAKACAEAAALTHCSQAALDQFALKHPGLRSKSVVVYNGINAADFEATPDCTRSRKSVLFVGRLDPQKGVDTLLDAWSQVTDAASNLAIAGDGPDRAKYQTRAANVGAERIDWLGSRPYADVIQLMKRAAILVAPSRDEGFPMTILEAMAAGCAIAATPVGGVPEQIEDGIHGLLVPQEDPAKLTAAIVRLLDDPDYASSLGGAAASRVDAEFDWRHITRQFVNIYTHAATANSAKRR